MEVLNNYKKYRRYKPEYEVWQKQQDLLEAKRLEYLKQHPEKINREDVLRAQSLLHALDVMDEYSQSNAEDMEVAPEFAAGQAIGLIQTAGMFLGLGVMTIPGVKNRLNRNTASKIQKGILEATPMIFGVIAGTIASIPIMAWAAKVQVGASRKGRFEAMNKDLKNPVHFALLDEVQYQNIKAQAAKLPLDESLKRYIKHKSPEPKGLVESIKTLKELALNDSKYKKEREEFLQQLEEQPGALNKQLSGEQIRKAKRDKQILTKLARKIDIASQDYTENVELAANTLSIAALAGGGLTGWLSNKAVRFLHLKNRSSTVVKAIPWVTGAAVTIGISLFAAKIKKQAARVGRFKVRQEMSQTPESLVYVEDEKAENIKNPKLNKGKKQNIFKFLIQAFKDNREYSKYTKTKGLEDRKIHKILEKYPLTQEQIKEAKILQRNTFKTFNKIDEKSQTYSESVEALGQMIQQPLGVISSLLGVSLGLFMSKKNITAAALAETKELARSETVKAVIKSVLGVLAGIIPLILTEYYITKEQKKASRIANMLAIKELDDYRHFADFDEKNDFIKASTPIKGGDLLQDFVKKYKP